VHVSSGRAWLPAWAWAGIGVSSFSAAAALAFCALIWCRRHRREQRKETLTCYLCKTEVAADTASAHRKQCARRNRAMLDKMPIAAVPGHVRYLS
jgi:hypothetical protein